MTEKLKPCPFCGGPATEEPESNSSGVFWIICDNVTDLRCGCEGPYRHSKGDAAEAWNRRPATQVTEAMVNAADSVLSRSRPGIPDELIMLAIAAALSRAGEPS